MAVNDSFIDIGAINLFERTEAYINCLASVTTAPIFTNISNVEANGGLKNMAYPI